MCVCVCTRVCGHGDMCPGLFLLHHVSPSDTTQAARLGGQRPPHSLSQKLSLLSKCLCCRSKSAFPLKSDLTSANPSPQKGAPEQQCMVEEGLWRKLNKREAIKERLSDMATVHKETLIVLGVGSCDSSSECRHNAQTQHRSVSPGGRHSDLLGLRCVKMCGECRISKSRGQRSFQRHTFKKVTGPFRQPQILFSVPYNTEA